MILFEQITFWHWFALAAALMIVEVVVPGVMFLWLGIAAAVTGVVLLQVSDLTLELQLIIFAALSVVAVVLGRTVLRSRVEEPSDDPELNQRGVQHVGAMYLLEEGTVNGQGQVKIGDSVWTVRLEEQGIELEKGHFIKVVDVDGATLIGEPASDNDW